MAHTPLKELNANIGHTPLNVSIKDSPKANTQGSIELSNYVLRKLNGQDTQLIDTINSELKFVQLKPTDRLLVRLKNEISRSAAEYKKLKSGHQKSKFDKKLRKIAVQENEIKATNSENAQSPLNVGKQIDNVSTPNRNRVVNRLRENLDKSLNFVESYGVLPKKLLGETFDGKPCVLNVDCRTTQHVSYDNLPASEKHEVNSMLNVCDSAMISDAAYHELSMRVPSMPRSHHVIALRNELNSKFDVSRTPGMLPGSYLSLESELSKIVRETKLINDDAEYEQSLKIKISGDGAKVSRVSNFLVILFSV